MRKNRVFVTTESYVEVIWECNTFCLCSTLIGRYDL